MSLIEGLKIAGVALMLAVYVGFIVRLWNEKVRDPLLFVHGLIIFTSMLIYYAFAPLTAVLIATFHKEMRAEPFLVYFLLILISPFVGVRAIPKQLPQAYERLIKTIKKEAINETLQVSELTIQHQSRQQPIAWKVMFDLLDHKLNRHLRNRTV